MAKQGIMSDSSAKQRQIEAESGAGTIFPRTVSMRIQPAGQAAHTRDWLPGAGTVVLLLCVWVAPGECSRVPGGPTAQTVGVQQPAVDQPASGSTRAAAVMPAAGPDIPRTDQGKNIPSLQLDPNAYIIGEQDVLMITVWKEKEISGGVVVRPDGKITVPLAGEVKVVGMTPVQLQTVLAEKLKPFVTVPQVTVAVTEIRSRKVYLIGHAAREGLFPINSSTTVLQIIAQAGGLKDFAKRKKIYILRQQGNEQTRFSFNYNDVIRGKNMQQNILLAPGDTIVVP
jgi:polysaccharide export outer membrane protein